MFLPFLFFHQSIVNFQQKVITLAKNGQGKGGTSGKLLFYQTNGGSMNEKRILKGIIVWGKYIMACV
jgi:hypothetical protein